MPNLGLVESAIARPYSGYHRPIAQKAAALIQSVATNHGFADGNKRTAIILTDLLLDRSGYQLVPINAREDIVAAVEELVLAVVNGCMTFDEIVVWLRARIQKIP